jgi:spore maturation protein CgeB
MCIRVYVKFLLFLSDFNETEIFSTDFEKSSNIRSYENLSSGSQVASRRWTDMMKLIIDFHNFVSAPKSAVIVPKY